MATRSRIGLLENGLVKSIYCHWDGYPSNNGKILKESYSDYLKLKNLFKLGDLSSLNTELETVVAYHRDRREDLNPPRLESPSDFNANGEEYNYYLDSETNEWHVNGELLTQEMIDAKD